jgi:hypothetical protein
LNASFGNSDTSRIIYVTDEVPAEDEGFYVAATKLIGSWCSCCFGLSDTSGHVSDGDANHPARDDPNAPSRSASVADDNASQHSKETRNTPSAAKNDAPLPPSHLIVETVNELKRVLDSVKVQQNQSDYAVAKVAEISTGVPRPPTIHRSLTQTGVLLPDLPRPKGPNSVRPRLPSTLAGALLTSDSSSFADDADVSPWGALSALESGGSERALQGRLAPLHDTLSATGGSLRGGSLAGNALTRAGSASSISSSVASESSRPVFQRRAPSAARNAPAAMAADPSMPGSSATVSVTRPVGIFTPVTSSVAFPMLRQESFSTSTLRLPLASPSHATTSHAAVAAPSRDVTSSVHEAAAAFPAVTFAHVQSQDASGSIRATPLVVASSEVVAPQAVPGHSSASSLTAESSSKVRLTGTSVTSEATAPLSNPPQSPSTPHPLSQPQDAVMANMVHQESSLPGVACNTAILERILSDVSASNLLSRFINDYIDDGDLSALAVTKPAKLMAKYGLNESQIAAFVAGCRQADSADHHSQHGHPSGDRKLDHDLGGALRSAANVDTFVLRPQAARALTAPAADAQTPRPRPPLPPLPSSFGT